MERWELIERWLLVLVFASLCGTSLWLFLTERSILLVLLPLPFAFWSIWQAFFEDRIIDGELATKGEVLFATGWLWFRRLTVGGVGVVFGAFGVQAAILGEMKPSLAFLFFAAVALWVAAFGGGRSSSMGDDHKVHLQRKARYKWWL